MRLTFVFIVVYMIFLSGSTCYATDRVRQVAILDVSARNSETDDAEVFSLTHI